MIPSNDIDKRHKEIQSLIADDNILQMLKRLIDFVRDFSDDNDYLNEAIVLSANYTRLERVERRGTLPFKDIEQSRNQLLYQTLELVDRIVQQIGLKIAA